jgi:dihydrofolate reductase
MGEGPVISAIVAVGEGWEIGRNNGMLWHLPDDFRHFKRTTLGHPVIMGRKTFESMGTVLKGRQNIVVTRNRDYKAEGAVVVPNLDAAIEEARKNAPEEVFIIGGGEIYRQAMPRVQKLYLTIVHHKFPEATTFFPEVDFAKWKELKREEHGTNERHAYPFSILWLERK